MIYAEYAQRQSLSTGEISPATISCQERTDREETFVRWASREVHCTMRLGYISINSTIIVAVVVIGSHLGIACAPELSDRGGRNELSEKETAQRISHGYETTRYVAATQALAILLEAHKTLKSSEFDASIRELSVVACLHANAEVKAEITSASIDAIYPTDSLNHCKSIKCCGCYTYDQEYIHGSSFSHLPKLGDE